MNELVMEAQLYGNEKAPPLGFLLTVTRTPLQMMIGQQGLSYIDN